MYEDKDIKLIQLLERWRAEHDPGNRKCRTSGNPQEIRFVEMSRDFGVYTYTNDDSKALKKIYGEDWLSDLQETYPSEPLLIHSPNGDKGNPDFYFVEFNNVFPISMKSSEGRNVKWNSGMNHPSDEICLLRNSTGNYVFLYEWLFPKDMCKKLDDLHTYVNKIVKERITNPLYAISARLAREERYNYQNLQDLCPVEEVYDWITQQCREKLKCE